MVIQHNLSGMNANRQLNIVTGIQAKSSEKLSSGYKVNRAADDAAGLAISEKMRQQIRGLYQGSDNLQEGVSLCQIADGALVEVQDMLQRMNELVIKASSDTLDQVDRQAIQEEINHLKAQISQIGASTSFNNKRIFDDIDPGRHHYEKLSDVIKSSAAETSSLSEAYQVGGRWYPAATLDFSGVDASIIKELNGKGFTFTCAANCSEVFEFSFDTGTNDSRLEGSTVYSSGTHHYVIGVKDCQNGADIVERIMDFAYNNPLQGAPTESLSPSSIPVSHTNTITRTGAASFVLWGNVGGYATAEEARNHNFEPGMGRVDCSDFDTPIEEDRGLWIQASSTSEDSIRLVINRMNSAIIGVDGIDVATSELSRLGIDKVKRAQIVIATERSNIGAQQNRLEHSYRNNQNKWENSTSAESRIRDTDMASEMVRYSNNNILTQAGQAILAQANQTNQGVMTLLQ